MLSAIDKLIDLIILPFKFAISFIESAIALIRYAQMTWETIAVFNSFVLPVDIAAAILLFVTICVVFLLIGR